MPSTKALNLLSAICVLLVWITCAEAYASARLPGVTGSRHLLRIGEIRLAKVSANDNFTLTISIWTRPRAHIDHNKVTVRVLFYDTIDPNMVVLTDSRSTHRWLTTPKYWMKENPQVLTVHHSRPRRRIDNFGPRRHVGYIVRVLYGGTLQDVVSKPEKLLPLFTPPNPASSPRRAPR